MWKSLISFAIAAGMVCVAGCLFGAPQVSTLAGLLVEKGYTPLTLKRAGNHFYVSCKLNGRSVNLVVDTGAGATVIASGTLKSLGVPLTERQGNVYGFLGLAGKNIKVGEIKDFQVGPYQAGVQPMGAWDFSHHISPRGSSMDGLLGIDFLHRHQAVIDCFRMHLFLKPPSAPSSSAALNAGLKAGGATEIPMQYVAYRGLTVPARINDRSGSLVIDTGMTHTVLSQQAIARLNMPLASAARLERAGWAMQDVGRNARAFQITQFKTMEIGNFSVPSQWVFVGDFSHSNKGRTDNVFFGYLGQDLLACYVGIIDCAALNLFLRFDPVIDAARRKTGL
jgi:predicted aspartyl protease